MKNVLLPITLAMAVLAGCTMAPKYERPTAPVSPSWPADTTNYLSAPANASTISAVELGWREFFGDPGLQRLIQIALNNNRDLRVAVLNVEQARAQYRIDRSALLPAVNAVGAGSRQRASGAVSPTGQPVTSSQYSVGVGVTSFEVDLFGRVRSMKNQAWQRFLATAEARKSAQITLIAEVASQYLDIRSLDEQLVLVRQTMTNVQSAFELARVRFEGGDTSELDLRSAETQVQAARVSLAGYTQLRAQADHALALLIGQPLPKDLPSGPALDTPGFLADLKPGLPSDLLQSRPDILAAEHQLLAANANIGAARAAFFPKILLTGSAGSVSAELSDLFAGPSSTWNFSPQVTLPLFAGGKNLAALNAAKTGKLIEVARYEKSIQSAFREVADALTVRAWIGEQLAAQTALVEAQQKRLKLAELRYGQGTDSFQEVLLAQQGLYAAQQYLIETQFSRLANMIHLYKAMGGGWRENAAAGTTGNPSDKAKKS